jgi:hypothetical protein
MNISISLGELLDKGLWDKFCKLKGWNDWCINEGLASSDDVVTLTIEEYKQIGGK